MELSERAKRIKIEQNSQPSTNRTSIDASSSSIANYFAQDLLSESSLQKSRARYESSLPYKHFELSPVFESALLKRVQQEILTKLNFTLKETDIYTYNQSGDLANLDGLPEHEKQKLPNLKLLRDVIYSKEFRSFISEVTGCGPLSGLKTDMSTNIYKDGNYLLLHDDVIEDRIISFIIYMPTFGDNKDWNPENGGSLELYPPIGESSVPNISPTTALSISFNKMVFFEVKPGSSFHSVMEVVSKDPRIQRISIQGWFHVPQEGEEGYSKIPKQLTHIPTLSQIQSGDEYLPFTVLENSQAPGRDGSSQPSKLSENDKAYLGIFVNPEYLSDKIIQQTQELFLEQSYIQLGKFLNCDAEDKVKEMIKQADKLDGFDGTKICEHGAGEYGRWKARGPSVLRRFLELDGPSGSNTAGQGKGEYDMLAYLLSVIRNELFKSEAFRNWLTLVTQVDIGAYRGSVRRFRPGLDYVLASPTGNTKPTVDANLCLTPVMNAQESKVWQSGDVGGYECYLTVEQDDAPATVYKRSTDEDPLLTVPASWNTLNLVYCEPEVFKFVKYVSASAPSSRVDMFYEYQSI